MNVVLLLLDSLNRGALGCYGARDLPTPAFDRYAARGIVMDNHYVGSLPCMQGGALADARTVLYDLQADPEQRSPIQAPQVEARLLAAMSRTLALHEAPPELYRRFDVPPPS